jgi:DNA-binding LacI/PurR family transcriptional regulator
LIIDFRPEIRYNAIGLIKPIAFRVAADQGGVKVPPRDRVTIRDVARKAGVSPGTVSRAINMSPLVNESTRARILTVVEELQYRPNLLARRLSIGKTLAIAVIVPFFPRPSVSERLNGAMSLLSQSHYDLVIRNIETPEQREVGFQDILRRDRVDGALILSLPIFDREVDDILASDMPVVLIDTGHPQLSSCPSVTVDDRQGGRVATEHLIGLGHRRIAFVGDAVASPFEFRASFYRHQGYQQALAASGIPERAVYYGEDQHGRSQAREMTRQMLALPEPPTAILAASDTQAIGVLEAARERGLSVPRDLSVVGYDDLEVADIVGLTTVRQLLFESGERGVELLLQQLQEPHQEPVHEVLPTELVVRNTTAPPG